MVVSTNKLLHLCHQNNYLMKKLPISLLAISCLFSCVKKDNNPNPYAKTDSDPVGIQKYPVQFSSEDSVGFSNGAYVKHAKMTYVEEAGIITPFLSKMDVGFYQKTIVKNATLLYRVSGITRNGNQKVIFQTVSIPNFFTPGVTDFESDVNVSHSFIFNFVNLKFPYDSKIYSGYVVEIGMYESDVLSFQPYFYFQNGNLK